MVVMRELRQESFTESSMTSIREVGTEPFLCNSA